MPMSLNFPTIALASGNARLICDVFDDKTNLQALQFRGSQSIWLANVTLGKNNIRRILESYK